MGYSRSDEHSPFPMHAYVVINTQNIYLLNNIMENYIYPWLVRACVIVLLFKDLKQGDVAWH